MFKNLFSTFVVCFALACGSAQAVGTLIPAPNRIDMVHDAARGNVYITEGGNVLRYNLASTSFLAPIALGGQLTGIDISPDGNTLVVADRSSSATEQWVYLVRLTDLAVTKATMQKEPSEDGTWSVAYGIDGTIVVTSRFAGSGWVPMRRLNPATLTYAKLGVNYPNNIFSQNAMAAASGNGNVIAFAESNNSSGPWGFLNVANGQLTRSNGYTTGTSAYNFEVAANRDGSQIAIPTYSGTYVYNAAMAKLGTLGQYASTTPIGVAFHPVDNLVYQPTAQTREIRVFETTNFTQVASYDFEDVFTWNGGGAYVQGRTKLSKDGSLLMSSVTGGVRYVQLYAPLSAAPVTGTVNSGASVTLGLKGSIGNAGALTYAVVAAPLNGTAAVSGSYVTYTPKAGFAGLDSFTYVAKYGAATAQATVTVSVNQVNRAPIAVNDAAKTKRNTAVTIPVLANDSDADGDALAITMVTRPAQGSVTIRGNSVVYQPAKNMTGSTSFIYSISDGRGGSASANVAVTVSK